MKVFLCLIFLAPSFTSFAAEPLLEKLDRLNIKAYLCTLSGTFDVDGKAINYNNTMNVFASDETEAVKSCLNSVRAIQLGDRADNSVSFIGDVPGFGKMTKIKSIEVKVQND